MSGQPMIEVRVDSFSPDDKPVMQCKCVHIDDPIEGGVRNELEPNKYDFLRKIAAEFIGTFFLVLCAVAGPIVNQKYDGAETLIGNAACSGVAVMIIVIAIGHISGSHLNPSVTIALAVTRHFSWIQVPGYIVAQASGSVCASFVLKAAFHPVKNGGVTVPAVDAWQAFILEFLATFLLMFVIVAVATDNRAVGELAGIAIGGTVLLDILVTGTSTGGSMNPVRTLGPAVASGNYKKLWIYMTAPPLGAVLGAASYSIVKLRGYEAKEPRTARASRR